MPDASVYSQPMPFPIRDPASRGEGTRQLYVRAEHSRSILEKIQPACHQDHKDRSTCCWPNYIRSVRGDDRRPSRKTLIELCTYSISMRARSSLITCPFGRQTARKPNILLSDRLLVCIERSVMIQRFKAVWGNLSNSGIVSVSGLRWREHVGLRFAGPPERSSSRRCVARPQSRFLMMVSTIFLASANSIMVLSRKNNSFSTPA